MLQRIWFCVCIAACISGQVSGRELLLDQIRLPPGFKIGVYATGVSNARSLALTPNGILFVGTRRAGKVYAVIDRDGDHRADEVVTIARHLRMPNGVAFRNGSLYVAEVSRVLRYDDIEARLADPPEPVVIHDDLPTESHHGWKFIAFGPDAKLYVPVGAPCNVCQRGDPYATILRMTPNGENLEVYARGVRNSVGFDWHPQTGEFWFTDNGRDLLGDNVPPCELNRAATSGLHFGYPYIHGAAIHDPKFGKKRKPSEFQAPALELDPHVAPLGMEFYTADQFPAEYRGRIFIAEHGSWNRGDKIGYRVTQVHLDAEGTPSVYEPFVDGWLRDGDNWGRPVDMEIMADGSLLLSDDANGVVYRISYP